MSLKAMKHLTPSDFDISVTDANVNVTFKPTGRSRCSGFALLFYVLLDQLVRSPIGETLTAIREDEVSASSLGINCPAWKVFAFGAGSAVAGAFYASSVGTLVPDAFIITELFTILAMVIVGGMGTLIGPV